MPAFVDVLYDASVDARLSNRQIRSLDLIAAFFLNAVLISALIQVIVARFPGEPVFADALEATDRVFALRMLRIARGRVRLALIHVLLASSPRKSSFAAAIAIDAVADSSRLVDENATAASAAIVEAGSGRIASRTGKSRRAFAIELSNAVDAGSAVQTFRRQIRLAFDAFENVERRRPGFAKQIKK